MAWDETKPADTDKRKLGAGEIRTLKVDVRTAQNRQHVAISDVTNGGKHLEGSARVYIWGGAELDVTSLNANFNSPASQYNKGTLVLDQPVGRQWICYDGSGGLWVELTKFGSLLSLSGGIVIPTTKTIEGPSGEAWIKNATQSMNPLIHAAARHILGGQDPLNGLVQGIIKKTGAGPTKSAATLLTHTYDFSGRTGNSTVLALAWTSIRWDQVGGDEGSIATMNLQLNDADQAADLVMVGRRNGDGTEARQIGVIAAAIDVTAAAARKIDFELKTHTITIGAATPANLGDLLNYSMLLVDLGPGVAIA